MSIIWEREIMGNEKWKLKNDGMCPPGVCFLEVSRRWGSFIISPH